MRSMVPLYQPALNGTNRLRIWFGWGNPGSGCPTDEDLSVGRPRMEPLFADQFTVSVKVVDAVVCAASLPVPVTVTVYAPAVVPALLTVTLAVPLAELKLLSPE